MISNVGCHRQGNPQLLFDKLTSDRVLEHEFEGFAQGKELPIDEQIVSF